MSHRLQTLLPVLAQLSGARDVRTSLASLARLVGQSPSYFQRTFARVVGESPKQYTRRLQLECAAALLLTTEDSILDVALASGFESHEGFTRAFSKHFGQAPKLFRASTAEVELPTLRRHAQLIAQLGPCVHLFRAAITSPHHHGEKTLNYDITQQPIDAMTLLCQTQRVAQAKIAEALGQILPAVFAYATQHNVPMLGPPITRYHGWGPGVITLEAGIPVAPGATGSGDIAVTTVDACNAAVAIHTGPYEGLADAHAAIELYLHEHGLRVAGPPFEVYLTDPGEVPDPADWKTRVVWPIEG
ncbi:MAG: hypothetical protein Tsb0020_22750 [Haliangiales bacterium]